MINTNHTTTTLQVFSNFLSAISTGTHLVQVPPARSHRMRFFLLFMLVVLSSYFLLKNSFAQAYKNSTTHMLEKYVQKLKYSTTIKHTYPTLCVHGCFYDLFGNFYQCICAAMFVCTYIHIYVRVFVVLHLPSLFASNSFGVANVNKSV